MDATVFYWFTVQCFYISTVVTYHVRMLNLIKSQNFLHACIPVMFMIATIAYHYHQFFSNFVIITKCKIVFGEDLPKNV